MVEEISVGDREVCPLFLRETLPRFFGTEFFDGGGDRGSIFPPARE
jgi:hypothetical protein